LTLRQRTAAMIGPPSLEAEGDDCPWRTWRRRRPPRRWSRFWNAGRRRTRWAGL